MRMNATKNAANLKKLRKPEEDQRKNGGKGGKSEGGGLTLGDLRVRVALVQDEGPQPPALVEEEHPTLHLRVSRRVKNGLPPPTQALVAPTRAARLPRSAASTGTLSACRPLEFKRCSLKRDRGAALRRRVWFSGSV